MKASNIDEHHHFVKFCKHKDLIRENGRPIGVQPWAFALRKLPEQEKSLSGVYYEFFDGAPDEKMLACFHFIHMEIKKKDALARMQVGSIKAQGTKRSRRLRVQHEPFQECLGYAGLYGIPLETDDELCALLARETITELVEASALL